MKIFGYLLIAFGLLSISCINDSRYNNLQECKKETSGQTQNKSVAKTLEDKTEIKTLIRDILEWQDSNNSFDLLPAISDKSDSIYIGFDINELKENESHLRNTGFFAKEFVENYRQIILTLDQKLKAGEFEYGPWFVGDMPPFNFASDYNPWCSCQDYMNWKLIEIEQKEGNDFFWKWGGLTESTDQSWRDFRYKFQVKKEGSKWKVTYLEGFDLGQ